jgi:hypothetical protein
MLLFFVAMFFYGWQIPIWNDYSAARYWPMVLLIINIFVFVVKVYQVWKGLSKEDRKLNVVEDFALNEKGVWRLLATFLLCVAYATLLPYGGFLLTTTIFGMGISCMLSSPNFLKMLLSGVIACFSIYSIFVWGLGIILPRGTGAIYKLSLWFEALVR